MKLHIESEGENFNMEAKAAYVVLIDPADRDANAALMMIGHSNYLKIISGIAKTLDSFFQTLTKGERETQMALWKIFKHEYKNARFTGTYKAERAETRPVREED